MQFSTLLTAVLLPAAALADAVTSTSTSTTTLTAYITLQRISTSTAFTSYAVNTTSASYYPTGSYSSGPSTLPSVTGVVGPTATPSTIPNAASTLGAAHVVIAGIAGMAAAALL